MNIVLRTHTTNPYLELRDTQRNADGSFTSLLVVRSGWFSAEMPLYFEEPALFEFIEKLEEMDRSLAGKAVLVPLYDNEFFVEFEVTKLGGVIVRGELMEHRLETQQLHFSFETDQTCLRPLIADLQKVTSNLSEQP